MPISAEAKSPSHIDRTGVWSMYKRVCMNNMLFTCSPKGHTHCSLFVVRRFFVWCPNIWWQNTFVSCINIAFFFFNYAWKWNDGNFQIPRKKRSLHWIVSSQLFVVRWSIEIFSLLQKDADTHIYFILYWSRCHFHILIHMILSLSFVCAVCI